MSYGIKYKCVWENDLELEIYQRDYNGAVKTIGEIQALNLQLDGDDDPCSPITKTILSFTIADTSDMPDTNSVKHGDWQEFYTPDATLYKVSVIAGGEIQWTGYITPDNWQESLDYRGSITVTARDNIGHLQDFDWDESPLPTMGDGLLSLYECLHGAMNLIEMPMDISYNYVSRSNYICIDYQDQGKDIDSFCINTKACEGKTIYDVMEMMLSSLGLCLRYTGFNTVCFDYIRYIPYLDYNVIRSLEIEFLVGGTKTMVPPYKKIIDTVDYNQKDEAPYDYTKGYAPGDNATYTGTISTSFGSKDVRGLCANNIELQGDIGWSGSGFLNASKMHDEYDKDVVYLCANSTSNNFVQAYGFGIVGSPNVDIEVSINPNMYSGVSRPGFKLVPFSNTYVSKIIYGVRYTVNGKNYYWDGNLWRDTITEITLENISESETITISLGSQTYDNNVVPENGELVLLFDGITFRANTARNSISLYLGSYMGVSGISLKMKNDSLRLKKDTVTTIVNDKFNVIDKRDTDFGPLSKEVYLISPANYENALYYRDTIPHAVPYELQWGDGSPQPFPSIRHKQYLMYHGDNEEMLEGDIRYKDGQMILLDRNVSYKGKLYIILSGNLNFLTGIVEGAILRSYKKYDDLWDN